MVKIGDRVIDLLGCIVGVGEVIDIYVSYADDPCGETVLVVQWGEGDDTVQADRSPSEVQPI